MIDSTALPPAFADLAPFAGWGLATETERNAKRIASEQADLEAFAGAMLPRMDAICAHLQQFPLDGLPEPERRLLFMLLSVAEVAPSVEGYGKPQVPDGYDSRLFRAQEDFPRRPRL